MTMGRMQVGAWEIAFQCSCGVFGIRWVGALDRDEAIRDGRKALRQRVKHERGMPLSLRAMVREELKTARVIHAARDREVEGRAEEIVRELFERLNYASKGGSEMRADRSKDIGSDASGA